MIKHKAIAIITSDNETMAGAELTKKGFSTLQNLASSHANLYRAYYMDTKMRHFIQYSSIYISYSENRIDLKAGLFCTIRYKIT